MSYYPRVRKVRMKLVGEEDSVEIRVIFFGKHPEIVVCAEKDTYEEKLHEVLEGCSVGDKVSLQIVREIGTICAYFQLVDTIYLYEGKVPCLAFVSIRENDEQLEISCVALPTCLFSAQVIHSKKQGEFFCYPVYRH